MTEQIRTKCPACGGRSLFIGTGGHLTCSNIDCPEPGTETYIAYLKAENERLLELADQLVYIEDMGDLKYIVEKFAALLEGKEIGAEYPILKGKDVE